MRFTNKRSRFTFGSEVIIYVISADNGAMLSSRRFANVLFVSGTTYTTPGRGSLHIRNARFYIAVSTTFNSLGYSYIAELSLDLATLFASYRLAGWTAGSIYQTAAGWNSLADNFTGSATRFRVMGLDQNFNPIWLQKDAGSTSTVKTVQRIRTYYPEKDGQVLYCGNGQGDAGNISFQPAGSLDVFLFDHNIALSGSEITNCRAGSNIDTSTVSLSYSKSDCYNFDTNRVTGWCGQNTNPQGYKLAVYGHRAPMPDEALRYLDTGVSVNDSWFMEVRSKLTGGISPTEFDDPDQFPLKTDYAATDEEISPTGIEETDVFLVDGVMDIAYYTYSDPEYIAPAATGDANLVFYGGNSSVQRVSVERSFEPSLLLIANRAASGFKPIFSPTFDPRGYQSWHSNSGTVSVDGLVELAQGNFKIAGRMNSMNLAGENFLALALGAVAGSHKVLTYVGTGTIRTVDHNLGTTPKFVLMKRTLRGTTLAGTALGGSGINYSRGESTTVAVSATTHIRAISENSIELGTSADINRVDEEYDMHVFQSSGDWTIDNVSGPGTGTFTVSLGFQPKAILFKGATGEGTAWQLLYRLDGIGTAKSLPLNAGSAVEADSAFASITADGFTILQGGPGNTGSSSAFYLAIK
jgi:hypothetical protein